MTTKFERAQEAKSFFIDTDDVKKGVKELRKQNILFAKSFLRRLHKSRVSFAQHSLTNFTCLLLKLQIGTSSRTTFFYFSVKFYFLFDLTVRDQNFQFCLLASGLTPLGVSLHL
ncbi:hypothetical protein SUGI_0248040 [Cryptomeria japonica]|nr:hypothetical protein SUGI_0248040 [Cryptomeria japonica]